MVEETVRVNKYHFYELYVDMCKMHNFPPLHIDNIDEVLVYFKGEAVIYSCFLWNTDSKMCMIGFPLSNLAIESCFREGCLTKFLSGIEEYCKGGGYNLIWTTSATDRVVDSLKERGFKEGDQNVNTYIKVVS